MLLCPKPFLTHTMQPIAVESSMIYSVAYDAVSQTLEVVFYSTGVYRYHGVPKSVYDGLMAAPSKGRYLREQVIGQYPFEKVRLGPSPRQAPVSESDLFELIQELTEFIGPVGQEGEIIAHIEQLWQSLGIQTERTAIGNLLGRVGGQASSQTGVRRKLLIAAHADELCYLVRAIDPNGFLYLANGQNWTRTTDLRNFFTVGSRVRVLSRTGEIPGVIASATGHAATMALPDLKELTWDDLWVDTGLSRDELIARGVTPGTRIVWEGKTELWGQKVVGKALDDRVPLAVMTEMVKRVPKDSLAWDVTLAATVQEEVGLIGASALASREKFDAAIIVEIGLAGDVPTIGLNAIPVRLGGGPTLVHKDSVIHYDHALTSALEQTAKDAAIPIQHAVFSSFGSDGAWFMRNDIPTAMMCFPARYTHSPFEMGHLGDIEQMVDWLAAFVQRQDA
jgi:endoglucanase